MMNIESESTLAELVDAHPELAREFERRGLDYCCGGGRTLVEACARAGLALDTTITELVDATALGDAPADWVNMSAAELVDHLEAVHHRYAWDELPRLSALVDKVEDVHGRRHPELHMIAARFSRVRADLEPH